MAYTVDQLISPLTSDQVSASIYTTLESIGVSTTSWQPGSPLRTIIAVIAVLYAGFTQLFCAAIRGNWLDTATGGYLTLNAQDVYGVTPVTATFATTTLTLNNSGGGSYAFQPGDVVFLNSTTNATYTNTGAFNVFPLQTGVNVPVQAVTAGTASNAAIGQINAMVTTVLGITCTNATAAIAVDDEQPDALRLRCRNSLGALSPNGPKQAYQYVCTTPALVGGATVTRVAVFPPPGDGTLAVVIANAGGSLSGSDVALVQTGVDKYVTPVTATVTVLSAVNLALTVTANVYVPASAGLDLLALSNTIKAALLAYVATLPIGGINGYVRWRALLGVIEKADPNILYATLASEADVSLAIGNVATLVSGAITVVVFSI